MPSWMLYVLRLALLGASLLLTALTVELALRLVQPPDPLPDSVSFVRHDPLLGWEKQPGANGRRVTDEYTSYERINGQGLRGPERELAKPPGAARALVLGDSFVEGYQVDEDVVFTHQLEGQLNGQSAIEWEVINGGTVGYSTDQALLFFRESGRLFDPDVTVLVFFLNDVWFNSLSIINVTGEKEPTHKPLFEVSSGRLELTAVPVPKRPEPSGPAAARRPGIVHWLKLNSRIFGLLRGAIKSSSTLHSIAIRLGLAARPQYGPLSSGRPVPVPDVYRVWEVSPLPAVDLAWQLTEAIIVNLRDEVEREGGKFMLFYAPAIVEVVDEFWEDTRRKYDLTDDDWSKDVPRERIYDIAARNGLKLIDPLEPMRESHDAGRTPYFVTDRHWNETGHGIVTGIIANEVLRSSGSSDFVR